MPRISHMGKEGPPLCIKKKEQPIQGLSIMAMRPRGGGSELSRAGRARSFQVQGLELTFCFHCSEKP